MNGNRPRRNMHMQYRRSVYRKRRVRTVVIISAVALVLVFALFLIVGNIFHKKTAEGTQPEQTAPHETDIAPLPADGMRQIRGAGVSLSGDNASILASLDAAVQQGRAEISVRMNARDGTLYYHSDIAATLGSSLVGGTETTLSWLISEADARGLYVSAVYYIGAFSEENDLVRSVALSETASVICEALRAGVDEAVLLAPDIAQDSYGELEHLISQVRSFVPEARLGLSLPESLVGSSDAALIDGLAYCADFLCLDITRYGEGDPVSFARERTAGMLYYLLRYKMRVLIPFDENADIQNALISAVESESVVNWQIVY